MMIKQFFITSNIWLLVYFLKKGCNNEIASLYQAVLITLHCPGNHFSSKCNDKN